MDSVAPDLPSLSCAVCGRLFNMGGPERLSRDEMARQLAEHLGVDGSQVKMLSE